MFGPLRKIGKSLRGGTHPVEVGVSVALGVLAGVTLGTNGLFVVLLALMLVLNTNKAAFGLTGMLCGALGWLLMPMRFAAGRWALSVDGIAGVFTGLSNMPGGALCGFDTYAVAGGVIAGIPLAILAGVAAALVTRSFRSKMLALVGDPEKMNAWSKGRIAPLGKWVLLGVGEADYEKSLSQRPVDYGPMVTGPAEDALTELTGAQVDVLEISLKPLAASLKAEGLALTDAADPSLNAVEVGAFTADISVVGLTQRSIVIEEARLSDVKFGTKRSSPGRVVRPPKAATEEEPPRSALEQAKSVENYIAQWGEYKAKFEKLQEILKTVDEYRGSAEGSADVPGAEPGAKPGQPLSDEDIAKLVDAGGYQSVRAPEVRRNVPDLLVKRLTLDKIPTGVEDVPSARVTIRDLAYPVSFGPGPVSVTISEAGDPKWKGAGEQAPPLEVRLSFDPKAASEAIKLTGRLWGLPAKPVSDALSSAVPIAFEGGVMNVTIEGTADARWIDLVLDVHCTGVALKPRGGGGAKGFLGISGKHLEGALAELTDIRFKVLVRGRTSRPRVLFSGEGFGKALKEAAARALERRAREEAKKQAERLKEKLRDKIDEKIDDKTKGKLDEIIKDKGGDVKEKGKKLLEGIFKKR